MAKSWYILHTYTGYEKKIETIIRQYLEVKDIDPAVVTDVRVPIKEVEEIKNGKKKTRKENFMPGYLLLEMDLPEFDWKTTMAKLRRIQGVTGFVGTNPNERPRPISPEEAKKVLQEMGAIKGEAKVHVRQTFDVGDQVKISDGPFATFTGTIKEVMTEKETLKVEVEIFGRPTPVELNFLQVEKVL